MSQSNLLLPRMWPVSLFTGAATVGTDTGTKIQRGKAQTFGLSVSTGQTCPCMAQKHTHSAPQLHKEPCIQMATSKPTFGKKKLQKFGTTKQAQVSVVTGLTLDSAMHDGSWNFWVNNVNMSCTKHGTAERGSAQNHTFQPSLWSSYSRCFG